MANLVTANIAGTYSWQRLPGITKTTDTPRGAAGGGGGSNTSSDAGGAGGGELRRKVFTGITAASVTYTVGGGGSGGADGSTDGSAGGDSFREDGSELYAFGGQGGQCSSNGGAGGLGGTGGVGTDGFRGGNGSAGDGSSGGGGGACADSNSDGNDASGSTGGAAPADGIGGKGSSSQGPGFGGSSGDSIGGGASGAGIANDVDLSGGMGPDGGYRIDVDDFPTLDVPTQPANTASGVTIATFTARMLDNDSGSPDTNADTAGAAAGVTISLTAGPGSITSGTTTKAYGSGADGSKVNFDDIVVTGSTGGTYKFTFTDNATGVTVDSATFTITAPTTVPASTLSMMGVG